MKLSISALALSLSVAYGHYVYPGLVYSGQRTKEWTHVRMTIDHFNKAPVQDVSGLAICCNEDPTRSVANNITVQAGNTVGFYTNSAISHPGPLLFYLAKVPTGETAATWDGSGMAWFKVYENGPTTGQGSQMSWPVTGSGEYLVRIEHIAMHGAYEVGGAQFYIACGQLNVTGGGNGTPGPLASFPGAYKATDSGILYDMYSNPKPYVIPSPKIWKG